MKGKKPLWCSFSLPKIFIKKEKCQRVFLLEMKIVFIFWVGRKTINMTLKKEKDCCYALWLTTCPPLSLDPVKLLHLRRPALAFKYGRKWETVLWLTSGPMTWHCIHCMDQSERASHSYTMVMTANCFVLHERSHVLMFLVYVNCFCFFAILHNCSFFLFYTAFTKQNLSTRFHHFFAVTTWCRFYSLHEFIKCLKDNAFWHFCSRGLEIWVYWWICASQVWYWNI